MSQQKVEAVIGGPVSEQVRQAASNGTLGLNWTLLLQLVQTYGPLALQVIQAILSGQVPPVPVPATTKKP